MRDALSPFDPWIARLVVAAFVLALTAMLVQAWLRPECSPLLHGPRGDTAECMAR